MSKKRVTLRISEELLSEFDRLSGTRTEKIEDAIQMYINVHQSVHQRGEADQEYVRLLRNQIDELERDKERLWSQINELNKHLDQQQKLQYQQQLEDQRAEQQKGPSLWQRFISWWKE